MKYRVFALVGLLALSAGAILQAQDYDDIYYDASKSTDTKTVKVMKPAKTVAVYGEVPDRYKESARENYRVVRDEDEYNRRGDFAPASTTDFEIDINGDTIFFGDTIYEEDFANTRRIERFYNPDIVILSDDDDLVELYYDESPTINLVIGSDWGYGSTYGWSGAYYNYYTPWYVDYYYPWYTGWYSPWYTPWHYNWYYHPWGYRSWGYWGYNTWGYWGHRPWYNWGWGHGPHWYADVPHGWNPGHRNGRSHYVDGHSTRMGTRPGLGTNRNGRGRVSASTGSRNGSHGIAARGANGNRNSGNVGRTRGGYAGSRNGNMGSRGSSGVTTRSATRSSRGSSVSSGGSRSSSSSSRSYGGSRSSSYGSSRSYGSSSSSSHSSGSYSGGSSRGSSGSYSGGSSRGSSGGGSHGGSSGGGGRRR